MLTRALVAAFACGVVFTTALPASAGEPAAAPAPPADREIKSLPMVISGSVVSGLGVIEGVLGVVYLTTGVADGCVAPGCIAEGSMFGNLGAFLGTALLVDAGVHLAVGIPLIVVGAGDAPVPVALGFEVGPGFTGLRGTF